MKRYALVVGMSVYESPHLESLPKTVHSAEAIAQVLEQYGDFQEVRRLPANWLSDERAEVAAAAVTEVELVKEIKYVLQQADLGELLIYFSGHGFVVADSFGDSKAYLAASNTQIDLTADQVIGQRQGISLESLSKELFHANLSSLVLLLDCCHAGAVITQASVQASFAKAGDRDYTILAACRAFEKAYAGDENSPYSIFTDALIRGLAQSQANDRGIVSSDRLADAVNERLKGQELLRMSRGRLITLVRYLAAPPKSEPLTEPFQAENPYRGLYSFEERHAGQFFGRESVIWDVVRRVEENRFLAVIGASGCGKSSLVKAGVVPKLRQNSVLGSAQWQIDIFKPGRTPHQKLMACLEKLSHDRPILLIIDQFEEVFTLCEDEQEKDQFMRLINYQVNQKTPEMRVVVTIRGDFLDRCANYEIAGLINKSRPTGYVVRPLEREELMAAIAQPAAAYGVTFETGLVNQIASDVLDRPGALPMLQYALRELWKVCVQDNGEKQLTWAGYRQIGGVIRALEKRANLLFGSFSAPEQALVQRIFTEELVQLNDDESVTRRRTTWARLAAMDNLEQVRSLVDQLADQRLVVTDETTVEVAHEALLSQWGLLRDWLERDREKIQLRRHLESSYNDWRIRYTRSDDALLMGALLGAIEEKLDWHNLPEAEYVQYSLARRDQVAQQQLEQERELRELAEVKAQAETQLRELAEVRVTEEAAKAELAEKRAVAEQNQAKSERRLKWFAITSTGVVSLLAAIAGFLWRNAEYQEVDALLKSAQAQFVYNRSSLDTLVAAVKADERRRQSIWVKGDSKLKTDALQVLQQASYWVRERDQLQGHTSEVNSVSFNPEGDLLASVSNDETIKLWDAKTGRNLKTFKGHQDGVISLSFASKATNTILATGGADGTVKLWNQEGKAFSTPVIQIGEGLSVRSVKFNPGGDLLATASSQNREKGTVDFWGLDGQRKFKPISAVAYDIAFSQDSILAIAGENGTQLWDYRTHKLLLTLVSNNKTLQPLYHLQDKLDSKSRLISTRVRFSQDGQAIIIGNSNAIAIVFEKKDPKKEWQKSNVTSQLLEGHANGMIQGVDFQPYSQTVVTASDDNTIKLWNRKTGGLIETLKGHRDRVNGVSFSKDGNMLASASADKIIRLWQNNSLLVKFPEQSGKIYYASISPDEQSIAIDDGDQGFQLWSMSGEMLKQVSTTVQALRFSPQPNSRLVIADDQGYLRFWTPDGKRIGEQRISSNGLIGLAIRPDGQIISVSDVSNQIYFLKDGTVTKLSPKHKDWVHGLSLNGQNQLVTVGRDKSIGLWDFTQNQKMLPEAHEQTIRAVNFTPNGKYFVTASEDATIKLWNNQGDCLRLFSDTALEKNKKGCHADHLVSPAHEKTIVDAKISPNSQVVASVSDDGLIKLWHIENGALIASLSGLQSAVNTVDFSPDGQQIVTGGDDKQALLWQINNITNPDYYFNWAKEWSKAFCDKFPSRCP